MSIEDAVFFNICRHGHIFPRHQNQVAIVSEFNASERPWAYRPACGRTWGRAAAKAGSRTAERAVPAGNPSVFCRPSLPIN
jgi:hypothetical protein